MSWGQMPMRGGWGGFPVPVGGDWGGGSVTGWGGVLGSSNQVGMQAQQQAQQAQQQMARMVAQVLQWQQNNPPNQLRELE